jgi:phage baseplate assembly protein gpV
MPASFNPTMPPFPLEAVVISAQPPGQLIVYLPMHGTGMRVPVRVMTSGPDDALRTNQKPLPQQGTHGLVVFANGDSRNGFWLGSYPPGLLSARTTVQNEPDITYEAADSGYWHYRDFTGATTTAYPDGTTIVVSPTGAPGAPNRTIVENNKPVQQTVEQTQRAPLAAPFVINVKTAGGVTIAINGDTVTVDASQVMLDCTQATVTGNLQVDGNIMCDGNIDAAGSMVQGYGTDNEINLAEHYHEVDGVQGGSSTLDTTPPVANT